MLEKFKATTLFEKFFIILNVLAACFVLIEMFIASIEYDTFRVGPSTITSLFFLLIGLTALIRKDIFYFTIYILSKLITSVHSIQLFGIDNKSPVVAYDSIRDQLLLILLNPLYSLFMSLWGFILLILMVKLAKITALNIDIMKKTK